MEQATTGKGPPPIAINSGGGIQILNMRGAATLGATVVPSPGGSAQTATVVGSPGPPGKGGVGPRMIISPQMLANRGPGQTVEESDTESVNQCDDDNHELKSSESEPRDPPASISGVSSSSDLQHDACDVVTVEYSDRGSELRKDDIIMSDDDSNNISKASSSDDFVVNKGSGQITDDNDLSLSNPSTVDKPVPGSPDNQVVNERSVSQCDDNLLSSTPIQSSEHSQSLSQPPSPSPNLSPDSPDGDGRSSRGLLDSRPPSCDENRNQDSSQVVLNENVVNSPKSSSSNPQSKVVDNLDRLGQVDSDRRMSVIDNNNTNDDDIVSNGAQKEINKDIVSVVEEDDENKKCTYSVPDQEPVNTETETSENFRPDDSPSSDLGALHGNNSNVDNSNQSSVQNYNSNQKVNVDVCEKSFVPEEEEKRCDNSDDDRDQQAFVTVSSACNDLDNNSNSCSSVLNKCLNTTAESSSAAVEEPPPLIREQRTLSTDIIMGNNGSKEPPTSAEEDPVDDTVDDVNLDMFSDSEAHDSNYGPINSSNGAIHVERSSSSSGSPCAGDKHGSTETTRTSQENRPKLMDMHLADFIFMDCDDDEIESVHETTVPSPINAPLTSQVHQTWNSNTTNRLTHSTSLEHPFSPPKIISEIFESSTTNNPVTQSVRSSTTTTAGSNVSHNSQPNNLTFWSNSKSVVTEPSLGSQPTLQSPPSCAFQMYNVGQGHSSNNSHQIAARIPVRSDHQQQQHNPQHYQTSSSSSSSIRIPQSTAYPSYPNNISMARNTGSSTGNLPQSNNSVSYPSIHRTDSSNAGVNSTNFPTSRNTGMGTSEYKSNYGQHNSNQQQQHQTLFTNDPQLLSQFVQYTKHFPLGRGDKQQDQTQISSSAPSSYPIPPSAITRGQYAHAPTSAAINVQQDKHSKTLPIKPVVVNPHSQQQQHSHHPMSSIRQTNASAQSHQRQQYSSGIPQQQHQYPQHPMHHQQQNSPFQSQYRSSSNIISANGCDNTSKSIGSNPTLQQQVNSAAAGNFQNSSNYSGGHSHGQSYSTSSASQNVRQTLGPVGGASGTYYPPSSSAQSQQMHIRQQQQHSSVPAQKELSSCSYANTSTAGTAGTRLYNPSQLSQPNFAGANPAGSHNSVYQNNVGYNSNTLSSSTARMSHSQNQQHSYPPTRPTQNTSSSSHINMSNYKPPGPGPMPSSGVGGWNQNPPLSARAKLLQVLQPNQNLAGRGPVPLQQTSNRMPYPTPPSQHHYRPSSHPSQSQHSGMPNQDIQQRTASVIAPRYPGGVAPTHGMPYTANSSSYNSSNISGGSGTNQPKQPSLPSSAPGSSPQMLRNPQYVAHFRPPTSSSSMSSGVPHGASLSGAYNQSVIRPNVYNSGNSPTIMNNSSINNSSTSRPFYGNSTSSNTSSNTYYNNQASVIRPPQSSSNINNSISGSTGNACTINRNSSSNCIVIERGGTHASSAGQHYSSSSSSSTGYPGDLTLQSFLSNPSAPFMCPSTSPSSTPSNTTSPLTERSTSSGGSGYLSHNANWGAYHAQRGDHGTDQDSYTLSSCQYTDAMRRYNAPITLQALSGLPPGANHLLVKTENGQFQLVSVRMQSPTAAAAAPGTPVVPSTVAAPPTSMSIAQQLPSNSPHAPPPSLPPPHSAPSGPSLVPPISSSMITTTTIPPHPSQQGRIITSSSSNHIVTSWSSSNNNSLVNNSTTSSPLPMISSSAAPPPHPPHLAPPPPSSAPHPHPPSLPHPPPPPVPSSVIMPPPVSASNSQLLSTANNISSSTSSSTNSSTNAAQAAISAVIDAYQSRAAAASASSSNSSPIVMGPPGGSRQPPPPLPNSIPPPPIVAPAAGPINSISQGASVIRSGVLGASSLPPPPPIVVSTSSTGPANSVISSSVVTSTPNSNLPSAAPTSPATFRPPNTASPLPNNNATNNAQSGMGMMMTASNSMSSVHPNHHHQIHPQYSPQLHPPPQQAPPSSYHTSNSIASSNTTANTVSQMSNETAKTKCKNFLSFLLELSAKQNQTVARNVKNLIQGLIDGKVNEENFADRLQKEVNSQPQPCLVGFLKKSLPHLRHSLAMSELKIEGIKPPPRSTLPAPVSALVPQTPPTPPEITNQPSRKKPSKTPAVRPTTPTVLPSPVRIVTPPVNSASPSITPPTPLSVSGTPAPPTASPSPSSAKSSKPSKGGASKSKSNSSSNSSSAGGSTASSGPGGTPSSKSSIPSTSKSSKDKEKKDKTFSSSGYSADDDINDVAAMGGVNLAEESQRILGSTEYVGTQIRSCRDETLIQASPIIAKFKVIAARYGLDEAPSAEVSALLSHAVEERLKTMIEKLSVIAEHRMDVIKLDERYEITQDVKGQLRFLEELDKLEKKRHDEQEREMLIRAAKSRSKSEDPEQAKLKAKAKEMQRVALEEMRQRDANLTALQAIGPRKKPKLDMPGGSHGSAAPSPLGATGASNSLGRQQMPLRPRLKRVNLRDLLFLLEHDKETMRSPFLYKNLLLK